MQWQHLFDASKIITNDEYDRQFSVYIHSNNYTKLF